MTTILTVPGYPRSNEIPAAHVAPARVDDDTLGFLYETGNPSLYAEQYMGKLVLDCVNHTSSIRALQAEVSRLRAALAERDSETSSEERAAAVEHTFSHLSGPVSYLDSQDYQRDMED